jgi:hypothetical protein
VAATGVAAAVMAVTAAAIVVAVIGLCLWARPFAGYYYSTVPGIYRFVRFAADERAGTKLPWPLTVGRPKSVRTG